jgi:hypothetical protein
MTKKILGLLCISFCILCWSGRTNAQVTVFTDMVHINCCGYNEGVGVAFTTQYSASYCVDLSATLLRFENEELVEEYQNTSLGNCEEPTLWVEAIQPYVEGSDYQVDGDATITANFTYEYYPGQYYDPAGFSYFNGLPYPMREPR